MAVNHYKTWHLSCFIIFDLGKDFEHFWHQTLLYNLRLLVAHIIFIFHFRSNRLAINSVISNPIFLHCGVLLWSFYHHFYNFLFVADLLRRHLKSIFSNTLMIRRFLSFLDTAFNTSIAQSFTPSIISPQGAVCGNALSIHTKPKLLSSFLINVNPGTDEMETSNILRITPRSLSHMESWKAC